MTRVAASEDGVAGRIEAVVAKGLRTVTEAINVEAVNNAGHVASVSPPTFAFTLLSTGETAVVVAVSAVLAIPASNAQGVSVGETYTTRPGR